MYCYRALLLRAANAGRTRLRMLRLRILQAADVGGWRRMYARPGASSIVSAAIKSEEANDAGVLHRSLIAEGSISVPAAEPWLAVNPEEMAIRDV